MTWQNQAACRSTPLATFFGNGHKAAQARCEQCLVADECLWDALTDEAGMPISLRFGVRGGLTAAARLVLERGNTILEALAAERQGVQSDWGLRGARI